MRTAASGHNWKPTSTAMSFRWAPIPDLRALGPERAGSSLSRSSAIRHWPA